jgi:hypothetical protein
LWFTRHNPGPRPLGFDFPSDGEKARQLVDIVVSDLSEFDGGEGTYDIFRSSETTKSKALRISPIFP